MGRLIRVPWTVKPPQTHGLDLSHPLLRDIQMAITFQDVSGVDVVQHRAIDGATVLDNWVNNDKEGLAQVGVESGSQIVSHVSANGDLAGVAELTVAVIAKQTATFASDGYVWTKYRSGFGPWYFLKSKDNGSNQMQFALRDEAGEQISIGSSYPASENDKWRLFVGTYDGNAQVSRLYWDGVEKANASYASVSTVIDRDYNISTYAARTSIDSAAFDIAACFAWHRTLTPQEIAEWNENWWQIFQPRTIYSPATAAGGNRLVTCVTESLQLTPNAASAAGSRNVTGVTEVLD